MGLLSKLAISIAAVGCTTCFTQIEDKEAFKEHAHAYENSYIKYANTDQGRFERSSKNALRTAYLACGSSDDEILQAVKGMKKVSKKCHEWIKKCNRGLLLKQEPTVSLDAFVKQARSYYDIHNLVKNSEDYVSYNTSHKVFKREVIKLIKEGCTVEDVTDTMKDAGIEDERILSRPLYWKKKDID
ncbi:hypothetical protein COB11_02755 [Candidatus Aerophobetes bacterium]|uniref:Uncharacterized protein n=1 Tax=Aerophobetes bacterium TaxID=2030807 RepID=A0A2A4YK89_UNCAE|nr:MAG: hypothetical protein COB11_02755 [Candidatus Aerophobetes bacterium]